MTSTDALPPFGEVLTPRLLVRALQASDVPSLLAINGDDAVTRFLPYATWQSAQDGAAWFERTQKLISTGAAQQLVVLTRPDHSVVGTVLLFRYEPGSARAELGYVVGRAHWRQGFAREALQAVIQQAFAVMHIRRLEAEVNVANTASSALLRGLGFQHEGVRRQRWVAKGQSYDVDSFGLLASDWARG